MRLQASILAPVIASAAACASSSESRQSEIVPQRWTWPVRAIFVQYPRAHVRPSRSPSVDAAYRRAEGDEVRPAVGNDPGVRYWPHDMYSLWRGGKCLGHFEEKGPVTRRGRRTGAFGILVPAEAIDDASSMMQNRIEIFPGAPTFQSPIPIEWVGNPPESVPRHSSSSGALKPLSPEAARGVPSDEIYEIRDDRGERVDAHMVVLQLHRFAISADAEESRSANAIDGDRPDYWTVTFATRLPDGEETTVVRQTDEPT